MLEKYQPMTYTVSEKDLIEVSHETERLESWDSFSVDRIVTEYTIRARRMSITREHTPEYKRLLDFYGEDEADAILSIIKGEF